MLIYVCCARVRDASSFGAWVLSRIRRRETVGFRLCYFCLTSSFARTRARATVCLTIARRV
jgi:hypothetical protein